MQLLKHKRTDLLRQRATSYPEETLLTIPYQGYIFCLPFIETAILLNSLGEGVVEMA